jgi:hypothetical protein
MRWNEFVVVRREDLENLFQWIDSVNEIHRGMMSEEEQDTYDNLLDAVYQPQSTIKEIPNE